MPLVPAYTNINKFSFLYLSIDVVKEHEASVLGVLLNSHPILEEKGGEEGDDGNVVVAITVEPDVDVPSDDP